MKTTTKRPFKYRKYLSLIILVVMFLLLTISTLLLNYLFAARFAQLAQALDVSGQQGTITQQLSKNLYDINLYIQEALAQKAPLSQTAQREVKLEELPQIAIYKIAEIQAQRDLFTQGLAAFQRGGSISGTDGNNVNLSPADNPAAVKSLAETQKIWTPYLGLLDNFIRDTQKGVVSEQTSNYLVDYSRLYNQALLTEANHLSAALDTEIAKQSKLSEQIQLGGLVLAFLLFFFIVFGALRQLLQGDSRLAIARQQTTDILDTVNEGLFLIDKELVISDEYSRSLESILQKKDLQGKTLLEILQGSISEADLNNAKLFVDQLYNAWVVEELIQDLNPLKQIKTNILADDGTVKTKYLDFNFLRINNGQNDEVNKVFVSVIDVTEAVLLERNLEKVREQHDRELEMIGTILSIDQQHLLSFIANTKQRIDKMNEVLKQKVHGRMGLRDKNNLLFREMHSLKGDASALGLEGFVNAAERQEELLKELQQRTNLSGNDFLSFTVNLEEMLELNQFISNLIERLRIMGRSMNHAEEGANTSASLQADKAIPQTHWKVYFEQYAQNIAQRYGKQVRLQCEGFDEVYAQDEQFTVYKDIAVQLLKNAIAHGIEMPEVREAAGKPAQGTIKLLLRNNAKGELCLGIEDDGQGIQLDQLRQKAVEAGLASAASAQQMSEQALYGIMMTSGISTAKQQTQDAGRGVGMDIVADLIKSAQGKLSVTSKENQFTRMVAIFPSN